MPVTDLDRFAWQIFQTFQAAGDGLENDKTKIEGDDLLASLKLPDGMPAFRQAPFRAMIEDVPSDGDCRIRLLSGSLADEARIFILPPALSARIGIKEVDDSGLTALVSLHDIEDRYRPETGHILCAADKPAAQSDMFSLNVFWLGDEPLYAGRTYRISTLAGDYDALVGKLKNRIDPDTGLPLASRNLQRGEIGQIEIEVDGTLVFDTQETLTPLSFIRFRQTDNGSTVGIGLIRFALRRASNIRWQELELDKRKRAAALGQKPMVLWFTGLSGCGKSTVASLLEKRLHEMGKHTYVLDGDNVRHGLCKDLGFTKADRVENMRRVTEVAKLMVDAGLIVLVTFISPFREERAKARTSFEEGEFVEIFVDTPMEICEARDVKGLYAKARAGLIKNFTGIDSPYEPPENPEVHLDGARMTTEEMVEAILSWLRANALLDVPD